ncbi:hypothetical protein ACLI4Q_06100 [Natrialbaceae archaeon A-CW1-1]
MRDRRQFLKVAGATSCVGLTAGCLDDVLGDGGDELHVATSITGIDDFNEQFEEDTGIEYNQLRTDAENVATRVIQEHTADNLSYDYRRGSDPSTTLAMYEHGAFDEVPESIQERWPNRVMFDGKLIADWMGLKLSLLYNEDEIDDPPSTFEELITEFKGEYAVDARDEFIWIALRDKYGDDQAKELVRELGEGARWSDSHYAPVQDIASGEYPFALTYNHFKYYDEFTDTVAESELSDFPIIVRQISSVILSDADNYTSAERYMEYSQENIQDFLNNTGRSSAYFDPDEVVGNDDFFVWSTETVADLDLEEEQATWQELSGLRN